MKEKTYKITTRLIGKLFDELHAWHVPSSRYQYDGQNTITTKDANVVDVATEAFINAPALLTVEVVKE